jgi:hypothetical protein
VIDVHGAHDGPIVLTPGSVVTLQLQSTVLLGLVMATPHALGRLCHMVAWSDGTIGLSNFGVGPLRQAHRGPGWSSTLAAIHVGRARVD